MKLQPYKRFSRSRAGDVLYFLFLLSAGLFTILPMIYSILTSFKPLDELMIFPPRFFVKRITLSNYAELPALLSNMGIPLSRYLFNSLFISFGTMLLHIIIASLAAFVLSKTNFRLKGVIFLLVQFSLLYNAYTLAIPRYVIFSQLHMIDTYWVYILPYLPSGLGVFLMKQYMDDSIPIPLIEAARMDGAGPFRIYRSIVMPIVKPVWLTLALFSFRDMWSYQPQGTIFSEQLKTLPYVMSTISTGGIVRSGSAMAATVLLMIPPVIVYMVSQSNVMKTMSSAGIKD